jgi:hypothetical protein
MPKVVLSAVDSAGADLVDVRVWVDGEAVAQQLDGREIEIDPGPHTVRFEHAGSAPIEQQVVIREGDRHRNLSATFAPAAASPPTTTSSSAPEEQVSAGGRSLVLPIALMGIGAAGVAAASYFWVSGLADHSRLGSDCAPTHSCTQSAVDSGRTKLVVGDVAGGLGIVAAAIGAGILLFGQTHTLAPASGSAAVEIQPMAGGAAIHVHGRF